MPFVDVQGEHNGGEEPAQGLFGPLRIQGTKPYARIYTSESGTVFLKEYRGVTPVARQEREATAIAKARSLGVAVPEILGSGVTQAGAWTAFRHLPGRAGEATTPQGLHAFVEHVVDLGHSIHKSSCDLSSGPGWEQPDAGNQRTRLAFPLDHFTGRAQIHPWWEELGEALYDLTLGPVVYLHGDLKAEHFLVDSSFRVGVVDWEACARGPAAFDYADALFHALRDLVYSGTAPESIPHDLLGPLTVPAPVMALRVLLWLDRRPPHGLAAADSSQHLQLLLRAEPAQVSRATTHMIAHARGMGVLR